MLNDDMTTRQKMLLLKNVLKCWYDYASGLSHLNETDMKALTIAAMGQVMTPAELHLWLEQTQVLRTR